MLNYWGELLPPFILRLQAVFLLLLQACRKEEKDMSVQFDHVLQYCTEYGPVKANWGNLLELKQELFVGMATNYMRRAEKMLTPQRALKCVGILKVFLFGSECQVIWTTYSSTHTTHKHTTTHRHPTHTSLLRPLILRGRLPFVVKLVMTRFNRDQ